MRRRRTIVWLVAAFLAHLLVVNDAFSEEEDDNESGIKLGQWDVQVGGALDFSSKYIWRGQNLVDDPVLQPSAYVGIGDVTASFWGNCTITDDKEWTERDYVLDYTKSLGFINPTLERVSLSLGYIYYEFPNLPSGEDTHEVYGAAAVDTILSPSITVYHDNDEGDGTYYEVAVGHSLPFVDPLTLNLSAAVGYNDGQWDFDSSFSSALLGAGVIIPLNDIFSFEPRVYYSVALDSQYDDELYAGFSINARLWE
jgi:hypothetical protein